MITQGYGRRWQRPLFALIGAAGTLATAGRPARANINLEWRPASQSVNVGGVVNVGLFAVSDGETSQSMSAAQVVFSWESPLLHLLGVSNGGSVPLLVSGLPVNDPYHLNEMVPPADGSGMYQALAFLGMPVDATPAGTQLTTFQFQAVAPTIGTTLTIPAFGGNPLGMTTVFDGTTPNTSVTGTLGLASVSIVPEPGSLLLLLSAAGVSGLRKRSR